jgi:calcium/calmodulin-dependent protein kinase I
MLCYAVLCCAVLCQVDLWAAGVIVYILLCGFPPFYGDNDNQLFRQIRSGAYKFLSPYWDPISLDAKDFVANLLVVDPRRRMDCAAALQHRWVRGNSQIVSTANLFAPKKVGKRGSLKDMMSDATGAGDWRSGMEPLRKAFALPADAVRIDRFRCALTSQPGHLHVTTHHLCFLASFGGKKLAIAFSELKAVLRAKRFKLMLGQGSSINLETIDGASFHLAGFAQREEAYACILSQARARGVRVQDGHSVQ